LEIALYRSITLLLLIVLAASAVRTRAQESPHPATGGALSKPFRQLDRDGKLGVQEITAL